jgi:flagellum-specific peptidoglycan hydrolase FlgJ
MMTKLKHLISTTAQTLVWKSNKIARNNWLKWSILAVILWLLFSKNISFQVSVMEMGKSEIEQQKSSPPKAVQTTMSINPFEKASTPKVTSKSAHAPADNFSNIAFILNPDYAKKHHISPDIVEKKNKIVKAYISRFVPIAKIEQNLYGIPTSITLAQGLLESDAGHSRLAKQNNNHFGIKCFSNTCAEGHCKNYTDDSHKDFFRIYKNAWESYRAHSLFLQKPRYKHLSKLSSTDYKAWARELSKAGYATDKRYAEKIILIIEALDLHQYDL